MQGHYGGGDILWQVEHLGQVLAEIETLDWNWDTSQEPDGAGLGLMKHTYHKSTGPAKGTFKMKRALLARADGGGVFLDLLAGSQMMHQEPIAASSSTYTVTLNTSLTSILDIRLVTSKVALREGVDYTVNYLTGVITFPAATPEAAIVRYLSTSKKNPNLIVNAGFEDVLTNVWAAQGSTLLRDTGANAYVETYGLKVTTGAGGTDGVKYIIATPLQPGRTYRLRLRAKGTAAETLVPTWNDGSSDVAMTPSSQAITANWALYEFTFVATKALLVNIFIKKSTLTTNPFWLDEVQLVDDTTLNTNPMDEGLGVPFVFNLLGKRKDDGVIVDRLTGCAVQKIGHKGAMKAYSEDIDGAFLDYKGE